MPQGKLIVIEGSDGSGKGTQLKLLVDYFKTHKIPYATLDFPQYYKTFFGRWTGRFLKGDFGGVHEIHPYLLMFPYAADRWQARTDIEKWLSEGKIVIANRYTPSAAYQAAKLPKKERSRFYDWSFEMEYTAFGIPREDLVIFLYVPFSYSQKLIAQKNERKYLGKVKDIHESNLTLMQEVEKEYLSLTKKYRHWVKIDCVKDDALLSREEIQQKILAILKQKKII